MVKIKKRLYSIDSFKPFQYGYLYRYIRFAKIRNSPSDARKKELDMIESMLTDLDEAQVDEVPVENEIQFTS